ncbi:hypothetical protein niasHT_027861 [Heterodera trifolii]|uniref:Uncharacterized protein n=1 Tax=Heterodera trifolii TaxID=157864 RepID=A0ABD2JKE7_9BILA
MFLSHNSSNRTQNVFALIGWRSFSISPPMRLLPVFDFSQQTETALYFVFGVFCMLFRNVLVQCLVGMPGRHLANWSLFCLDFCALVVPMFLGQTFWADYLALLLLVQLALCAAIFACCDSARACGVTPLRSMRPLRVDAARAQRDAHTMFR